MTMGPAPPPQPRGTTRSKWRREGGAPILNIFGGKITTYRRLAESALDKIAVQLPGIGAKWTAGVPLPGGDFPVDGFDHLVKKLRESHPFRDARGAHRLGRAYGTEAPDILGNAQTARDLGTEFGATLTEAEVIWLIRKEVADSAEDVAWRRNKLGLRMTPDQISALDDWMLSHRANSIEQGRLSRHIDL